MRDTATKIALSFGGKAIFIVEKTCKHPKASPALAARDTKEKIMNDPDIWEQYRKDMAALLEGFRQTIANNTAAMNRLTAAVERLGAEEKPFTASDNADIVASIERHRANPEPPRTCGECENFMDLELAVESSEGWGCILTEHEGADANDDATGCPDFESREVTP